MSVVKLFPSNLLQSTRKERKKRKIRSRAARLLDREALQNPHTSLTEEALQKNPEQERNFR
jgi:hypothetical protein